MVAEALRAMRLNALSGIGGVRTKDYPPPTPSLPLARLNALSGIGGVRTDADVRVCGGGCGLNALSGIGGVRTCPQGRLARQKQNALNALSGIGGVRTAIRPRWPHARYIP